MAAAYPAVPSAAEAKISVEVDDCCSMVKLIILVRHASVGDGVGWGDDDAKVKFRLQCKLKVIIVMRIGCYLFQHCCWHFIGALYTLRS